MRESVRIRKNNFQEDGSLLSIARTDVAPEAVSYWALTIDIVNARVSLLSKFGRYLGSWNHFPCQHLSLIYGTKLTQLLLICPLLDLLHPMSVDLLNGSPYCVIH